jgi:type IX secretion system PorP/SprF family membrane protein
MKSTQYIVSLLIAFGAMTLTAQDYHLSQYDAAPLYLNPALAGLSHDVEGDYRVTIDSRSQWRALGNKPFSTQYAGFDMVMHQWDKRFGVGGYLINNRGGIGSFNTFNFMASGAYDIINDASSPHVLRTGLNIGLMNKSVKFDNYSFDSQYSYLNGGFDQSLNNNENNLNNSLFRFDAAMGIYYKYVEKGKPYQPAAGLSVHHFTMPRDAFFETRARLPMRWVFHTDCFFELNEKMYITPKVLFMHQAKANELNVGLSYGYIINEEYSIIPGIYYRNKDAFVFDIGFKFANNILRLGYDVNTSYLSQFTGGRGAFEVSLVVVGVKGKSVLPSFML